MIKEFDCTETPACRPFEKRFATYAVYKSAEVLCPVCNRPAQHKVSRPAPARFKGSGFHVTDYGKGT